MNEIKSGDPRRALEENRASGSRVWDARTESWRKRVTTYRPHAGARERARRLLKQQLGTGPSGGVEQAAAE